MNFFEWFKEKMLLWIKLSEPSDVAIKVKHIITSIHTTVSGKASNQNTKYWFKFENIIETGIFITPTFLYDHDIKL